MLYFRINYYYARLLQEIALRTGSRIGKPTGAILLLTNRCNARCVHCYSWKLKPTADEMTAGQWKDTLSELRKWLGPIFVSITGGETFLKQGFIEITRHAAGLGLWVEFLTNGYLMSAEKAGDLVGTGVRKIKISLDGSKPEIHDKIRGRKDFFERTTHAINLIAIEKKRQNADLELIAKTAIMSHNVDDIGNIVILARKLGVDGIELQAIEPVYYSEQLYDPLWYHNNPLWIEDHDKVNRVIDKLVDLKMKGLPIVNSIENLELIRAYFISPQDHAYKVHSHEYKKTKPRCTAFAGGLQIMPDGGLKMCHWMEPFGNAKKGNIKQQWNQRFPCWKHGCKYLAGPKK